MSFYIPRIYTCYTQEDIVTIFNRDNIGTVTRVDFVKINGMDSTHFHSAFVHCHAVDPLILRYIEEKSSYRLAVNKNEYWILLKNKNPVSETRLNIHQVVENASLLERKVEEQQKIIEKQAAQIERIHEAMFDIMSRQIFDTKAVSMSFNQMKYGPCKQWISDGCDKVITDDIPVFDFECYSRIE